MDGANHETFLAGMLTAIDLFQQTQQTSIR